MVAAVLLGALAQVASAQTSGQDSPFRRGIDVVPVKPTPTAYSGLIVDGARLSIPGTVHAALVLDAAGGVLGLRYGSRKVGDLIPFRLDAHLLAAYQLTDRLELAGDLPFTMLQIDNFQLLRDQGFNQPGVAAAGLGDLRVMARYVVLDPEASLLGLAALGEVRLNIGDEGSFLGDRAMVFGAKVAAERTFGPNVRALGNLGFLLRPWPGQFLNLWVRSQISVSVGVAYRFPDMGRLRQVDGFVETNLMTPLEAPFTISFSESLPSPWGALVGARAKVFGPFRAELAVGRGVTLDSAYGRESFRVMAALRYDVEPAGGDADADGVPDKEDACPDVPEDRDGFEDGDGCPDLDNDKDGVADPDDQCPDDPGPKELDGCPDRDEDDVPDIADKCPDDPGPAENEGCPTEEPQVVLEADRIRIRGNIFFDTAEARIQEKSFSMLDEVYKVLKDHPEIDLVRVDGHTDNRGSRPYNLDLSNRRAKAVMEYLIKKGTAPKRLRYRGFGFDKPVATNATPLGRAKNRRVEFNLLDAGGGDNDAGQELEDTGAQVTPQGSEGADEEAPPKDAPQKNAPPQAPPKGGQPAPAPPKDGQKSPAPPKDAPPKDAPPKDAQKAAPPAPQKPAQAPKDAPPRPAQGQDAGTK